MQQKAPNGKPPNSNGRPNGNRRKPPKAFRQGREQPPAQSQSPEPSSEPQDAPNASEAVVVDPNAPPNLPDVRLDPNPLSSGPLAVVYRGRDRASGAPVVVKVQRRTDDLVAQDRFRREARILAALRHPNIVALYRFHDILPLALVLEYVSGKNLAALVGDGRGLPLERACRIIEQVAAALDCAHAQGIVHRDVKPSNILIPARGPVKLSDFGVAYLADESQLTIMGDVLGTVEYASPEQLHGIATPDSRTDVYSLAAVTYFALVGTPPFRAQDSTMQAQISLMHLQVYAEPPSLRLHQDALPEAVDLAVLKGLAKAPDDRYQSAGQFAAALRSAVETSAGDPEHRVLAAVAARQGRALAAAAALLILGALVWEANHHSPAPAPIASGIHVAQGTPPSRGPLAPSSGGTGRHTHAPPIAPTRLPKTAHGSPGIKMPGYSSAGKVPPGLNNRPSGIALRHPKPLHSQPLKTATVTHAPKPRIAKAHLAKAHPPKAHPSDWRRRPFVVAHPPKPRRPLQIATHSQKPRSVAAHSAKIHLRSVVAHHPKTARPLKIAVVKRQPKPSPTRIVQNPKNVGWLTVWAAQNIAPLGQTPQLGKIAAQKVLVDGKPMPALVLGKPVALASGAHWVAFYPDPRSGYGANTRVKVWVSPNGHVVRQVLLPVRTARPERSVVVVRPPAPIRPSHPPIAHRPSPLPSRPPAPLAVGRNPLAAPGHTAGYFYVYACHYINGPGQPPRIETIPTQAIFIDGHRMPSLASVHWFALTPGHHSLALYPDPQYGFAPVTHVDLWVKPHSHALKQIVLPKA